MADSDPYSMVESTRVHVILHGFGVPKIHRHLTSERHIGTLTDFSRLICKHLLGVFCNGIAVVHSLLIQVYVNIPGCRQVLVVVPASRRFLLPIGECEFAISSVLDDLQKDAWPVTSDKRPQRCTGVALSVAVGLLEATYPQLADPMQMITASACKQMDSRLLLQRSSTENAFQCRAGSVSRVSPTSLTLRWQVPSVRRPRRQRLQWA